MVKIIPPYMEHYYARLRKMTKKEIIQDIFDKGFDRVMPPHPEKQTKRTLMDWQAGMLFWWERLDWAGIPKSKRWEYYC